MRDKQYLLKKITNYQDHLPALQSDLANEILKDPYNFDFLTINEDAHERAIEEGLINNSVMIKMAAHE